MLLSGLHSQSGSRSQDGQCLLGAPEVGREICLTLQSLLVRSQSESMQRRWATSWQWWISFQLGERQSCSTRACKLASKCLYWLSHTVYLNAVNQNCCLFLAFSDSGMLSIFYHFVRILFVYIGGDSIQLVKRLLAVTASVREPVWQVPPIPTELVRKLTRVSQSASLVWFHSLPR